MTTMDSKSRFPPFGMASSAASKGPVRATPKPVGSGWNIGAWGSNGTIGSGVRHPGHESSRTPNELADSSPITEPITGSRSLLPSSESELRASRQNSWKNPGEDRSPGLPVGGPSPLLRQRSNHSIGHSDTTESPFFSITAAPGSLSGQPGQSGGFIDSSTRNYGQGLGDGLGSHHSSRHNSDENDQFAARKVFGGKEPGLASMGPGRASVNTNNVSGYNSTAVSRSGSQPPSRSDARNFVYPRTPTSSSAFRPGALAHAPPFVTQAPNVDHIQTDQFGTAHFDHLTQYLDRFHVGRDDLHPEYDPIQAPYDGQSIKNTLAQDKGMHESWQMEDEKSAMRHDQLSPAGSGSGSMGSTSHTYRNPNFAPPFSHSPKNSDSRVPHQSPFYMTGAAPPYQQRVPPRVHHNGLPPGQATAYEHPLQGLHDQPPQRQHQQRQPFARQQPNPLQFQNQIPHPYDMQSAHSMRMNPLSAAYYNLAPPPSLLGGPPIPRGPARDLDMGQHVRSPLLEDFRNNSKTNKRYELKDIYNHIVEFSGDQHGSRFIQQKLETANSDEKDQVFRELHPNSRQLMTDVFGNYVIQKFFEHGNQAQKKLLANQMRTHVLTLSLQIYGCRVVQKALEHILTDQQAQLVKELKNDVMKCVKDQNGNHVIQKAIERVPAEHIQFIINAFTGRVQESAVHPYGCRVIQRMLEYCEEPTRNAVLHELHGCASSLIVDQYGNYVAQHVIEHGKAEDRGKIIDLVTLQLVNYSKHKFASNVVEKSIQFGSQDERQAIVSILSVVNDKGESPVQGLIRDQYGNYVMQKLITQLRGPHWSGFIELIKVQISLLKRLSFGNGKQIAAVEKVLYTDAFSPPPLQPPPPFFPPSLDTSVAATPPLAASDTQSPQSSSVPSTHANSVDASNDSRKSSGSSIALGIKTP